MAFIDSGTISKTELNNIISEQDNHLKYFGSTVSYTYKLDINHILNNCIKITSIINNILSNKSLIKYRLRLYLCIMYSSSNSPEDLPLPVAIHTRSHHLPFNSCWNVRVPHNLPPNTDQITLRRLELAYQFVLSSRLSPGINLR